MPAQTLHGRRSTRCVRPAEIVRERRSGPAAHRRFEASTLVAPSPGESTGRVRRHLAAGLSAAEVLAARATPSSCPRRDKASGVVRGCIERLHPTTAELNSDINEAEMCTGASPWASSGAQRVARRQKSSRQAPCCASGSAASFVEHAARAAAHAGSASLHSSRRDEGAAPPAGRQRRLHYCPPLALLVLQLLRATHAAAALLPLLPLLHAPLAAAEVNDGSAERRPLEDPGHAVLCDDGIVDAAEAELSPTRPARHPPCCRARRVGCSRPARPESTVGRWVTTLPAAPSRGRGRLGG